MFKINSFLLWISILDHLTCCKKFEVVQRNCFFASKVTFDEGFELIILKLESRSLNEISEVSNVYLLLLLVINPIEESFKEDVILLFITVLHWIRNFKCSHQLAKLLFVDLSIFGKLTQVFVQRFSETSFCCIIMFVNYGPFEKICNKLSYFFNW